MNIDEIRARYQRALDAKPSKGDYTQAGIDAITDSVCDIPDLLSKVDQLTRWKSEAMAVMGGLQELGRALNLPLGARITATSAAEKAKELTDQNRRYANRIANHGHALQAVIDEHVTPRAQKLAAIHELAEMIADHYGDAWDHTPLCLNEPGCPLCGILAASENP